MHQNLKKPSPKPKYCWNSTSDLKEKLLQDLILNLWIEEAMPYIKFRSVVEAHHKKVPINTVVLPPLQPGFKDHNGFIANIMVNKSKSTGQDLVTISRASEHVKVDSGGSKVATSGSASDASRILQLEHNIRFLQEQHQLMLAGLHSEIDILRNRNRELQFQLIFAKGTPSTPSSPDDETKQKIFSTSPKQINATPLQVEILEKELGELRLHVQEVDGKNAALTVLVEEQNGKLQLYEHTIATYQQQHETEPPPTKLSDNEQQLLRKLDDAESVIRRLRRDKSDVKRDVAVTTAAKSTTTAATSTNAAATTQTNDGGENRDGGYINREYHRDGGGRPHHQHRGGRYHHRSGGGGGGGGGNYRGANGGNNTQGGGNGDNSQQGGADSTNWFPPLYQPNYWTNGSQTGNNASSNGDLPSATQTLTPSSSLPTLQQPSSQQHHHGGHQRRSGHNNNYGDGGGGHRKYHNRGHHNRSGRGGGGDKST